MNTEEIRKLTVQGRADGVDEATASLRKFAAAGDQVSAVSERSTRATLSVQSAYEKQVRSLDSVYRSQQSFAKAEETLTRARDQGLVGQDRYNQLIGLAAEKYNTTSGATKAFQTALGSVNSQIVALSAGFGPLGTTLAAFGPLGLIAAAGIGLVTSSFGAMAEGATAAGHAAIETRNFLLTTGLAADQFSALKRAASEFAIAGDEVGTRIDKFTTQFHELNDATGTVYDAVRRINPAIASQMVVAHDTGTQISLLAQAYQKADQAQRALLANAAFGKGGVTFGPLLGSVAEQGGLDAMRKSMGEIGGMTQAQIDQRAALTIKIDENYKAAERLKASIYTDSVLAMQLKLSEATLAWANAITAVTSAVTQLANAPSDAFAKLGGRVLSGIGGLAGLSKDDLNRAQGLEKLRAGLGSPLGGYPEGTGPGGSFAISVSGTGKGGESLTSIANDYNRFLAAMGAAATPAEHLQGRLNELAKALEANDLTTRQVARAQDILAESFKVDALNRNMAALGAAKTPAEQYTQTVSGLNLQLHENLITQDNWRRGLMAAAEAEHQAISSGRERLGLLSDQEQRLNANAEIQKAWSDRFIRSSTEEAAAQQVLAKSIRDTSDRMQVLRSPLPGLTQAALDAGNLSKQLDTLTTGSLTNLGNGLTDILTGTVDLSTGIKNMEQQFIKSLANMLVQMTIIAPIAQALRATLGGLTGIPGLSLPGVGAGPTGNIGYGTGVGGYGPIPEAHSGGIVGQIAGSRYVHPAYFDNAPRFHTGGIVGGEVPIVARRGEGVFTPAQMAAMGSGGHVININSSYNIAGAVDKAELAAAIKQSHNEAVQKAVSVFNATAPARQDRYNKLGT